MRIFAAAIAAFVCSVSMTANQPSVSQVVFVCEHGNVKSLMAASYFNQLAEERGLRWRAISRGSAPDSATVPDLIAAKLRADAIDVSDFRPVKVEATEVAEATRVVTIGTDLPAGVPAEAQRIERWNDVPPASTSYDAARTSLKAHVAELLDRLSRGPADR